MIAEQWESVVDRVADGYRWGYYEFTNELAVRDLLAKAFEDEVLCRYNQVAVMRERVGQADIRLRGLFIADTMIDGEHKPWWWRGASQLPVMTTSMM